MRIKIGRLHTRRRWHVKDTPAASSTVKPMIAYAVIWTYMVHMAEFKRFLWPSMGWACRFPVTEAAVMMLDMRGAMN